MGVESKPYYWVTCDAPGCGSRSPSDDSEYTAWGERAGAESSADDDGFVFSDAEGWLCEDHPSCGTCGAVRTAHGLLDADDEPICPACASKTAAVPDPT